MVKEKVLTEKRFIEILDKRRKDDNDKFSKEMFGFWLLAMVCFIMAEVGAYMLGKYDFF